MNMEGKETENKEVRARLALGVRDRDLAEKYAVKLRYKGFAINNVASRGVSFSGTIEQFELTFRSEVKLSENNTFFEKEPVLPEDIKDNVDSIYFPSKPIFLLEPTTNRSKSSSIS